MKTISTNKLGHVVVEIPATKLKGVELDGKVAKEGAKGKVLVNLMAAAARAIESLPATKQEGVIAESAKIAIKKGHPKDADKAVFGVWSHHVAEALDEEDALAFSRSFKAAVV